MDSARGVMVRYWFRIVVLLWVAAALSACAGKHTRQNAYTQGNVFEVTSSSVSLSNGVDPRLKDALERRLDASISVSHRGAPMQQVSLEVSILNVVTGDIENDARVQVVARRAQSGEPLYLNEFKAISYSPDGVPAYVGLADAIASRIRVEFALATPSDKDIAERPRISTILSSENRASTPMAMVQPSPRAGGDALLNANTQFGVNGEIDMHEKSTEGAEPPISASIDGDEPCVVTADNDCTSALLRH